MVSFPLSLLCSNSGMHGTQRKRPLQVLPVFVVNPERIAA